MITHPAREKSSFSLHSVLCFYFALTILLLLLLLQQFRISDLRSHSARLFDFVERKWRKRMREKHKWIVLYSTIPTNEFSRHLNITTFPIDCSFFRSVNLCGTYLVTVCVCVCVSLFGVVYFHAHLLLLSGFVTFVCLCF